MKILLLAPEYLGLYKPILSELQKQGHIVKMIKDEMLDFDWHYPYRSAFDKLGRIIKATCNNSWKNYWRNRMEKEACIKEFYDLFICINGCCVHPILLKKQKEINPRIKTVLYLWDNSAFYDYFHNAGLFDKVMTYDINDSVKYKVQLLPFYWVNSEHKDVPIQYTLSMVGSNHDNRYGITKDIVKQCKNRGGYRTSLNF